jgi:hypothetical protein
VLKNDAGHGVHVHIVNYQDRHHGGAGMIRLYVFDLVRAEGVRIMSRALKPRES